MPPGCRVPGSAGRYDAHEIDGLPTPVQRYFRAALTDGQPLIAAATFELAGTFNRSATGEKWKPFTSMQRAVTHRPGFLWNGRVSILPGLAAQVHDSYIAGVGTLHAPVLGVFTVVQVQGGGEIARGELMRYRAWRIYGARVLAPCAGQVLIAVDGLPDMQVPEVDGNHLAGNHVMLRCAEVDVVLGHLQQCSVWVMCGWRRRMSCSSFWWAARSVNSSAGADTPCQLCSSVGDGASPECCWAWFGQSGTCRFSSARAHCRVICRHAGMC